MSIKIAPVKFNINEFNINEDVEHQKQAERRLLRLFFSGGTRQNMIRSGNSQSLPTFIDERGTHQSPDFNYFLPHQ